MMFMTVHELPFGGVGPSGMGHYHGYEGFVTFSCVLAVGEEEAEVGERSRFAKADGRWLYHSGVRR